ncbi:unnamed protein product [Linum tenue]|uniref:Uncharacterized protein n=1 Tax=Linum tenue TaxID=586396 RepID=A0AAV0JUG3_9ROSI|nr:unnamed protein product [Linum tenue]
MATPAADSDGDIAQPEVASTPPPAAAPATDSPAAVAVPPTETSPVHDSATSSGGEAPLEPDAAATPPPAQPILRRGDRVRRPSTRLADGPRFDFMGSSFQFLPFGSGRRVCVGLNLAERLMKYVLASMLHSFEWKLPDGEEKLDFSDKLGVVAKKVKPLVAIPFPRRLGKLVGL